MFRWFRKNAAFLTGWLDWAAMYPLMRTESGREQVVRFLYAEAKRKPNLVREMIQIYCRLSATDLTEGLVSGQSRDTPDADRVIKAFEKGTELGTDGADFVPDATYQEPITRRASDPYDAAGRRIPHPLEAPANGKPTMEGLGANLRRGSDGPMRMAPYGRDAGPAGGNGRSEKKKT